MVYSKTRRSARKNQLHGTLRQRKKNGQYYYRLVISTGIRKEFALKTSDHKDAVQKASELDSIWLSPTSEVAFAQMNAIRGFSKINQRLTFENAWEKYQTHPERAMPHTFNERRSYQTTYEEFARLASKKSRTRRKPVTCINEVSPELCAEYSDYLKTTRISVDLHNRKIKRLRRIFNCLRDYYEGDNPFCSKTLMRNTREETGMIVHRQPFTKEQEDQILEVLSDSDPNHNVMNKAEIRIIYTIGIYTGQRLKDCVLLQWHNIDMKNRRIWVKQYKTGKEVTIPIADKLYEALLEAEKWRYDQYVTPKTAVEYHRKRAKDGSLTDNCCVDKAVLKPIQWIGLEPSVTVPGRKKKMNVYGFHSLRHSFASFCAEAGIPKAVLLSILGTNSEIADKYYTHVSEESQKRAIEAISSRGASSSQDKIDRVLKLLMPEDGNPPQTSNSTLQQILEILKEA